MKLAKKWMVGLSAIGLTVGLTACGNEESKDPNEGDYTLSDVLNSKESYEVVVTDDDSEEDGHVVWGGFIGKGNIEGVYLDATDYGFGYNELKKLSTKEFKESLNDMGNDYMSGKFPRSLVTTKGSVSLIENINEDNSKDKADAVAMNVKFANKDDEDSGLEKGISKPYYSDIYEKEKDSEWTTIKADSTATEDEYDNYKMHIRLGGGKNFNLKLDNIEETKDKYNNVKVEEYNQ